MKEMGVDGDGAIGHHTEIGLDDIRGDCESAVDILETHLIMAHAHDHVLIGDDTQEKKKESNVMIGKNHGCVCLYLQTTIFFFLLPKKNQYLKTYTGISM